jgi:hypothetical protein
MRTLWRSRSSAFQIASGASSGWICSIRTHSSAPSTRFCTPLLIPYTSSTWAGEDAQHRRSSSRQSASGASR